MHVNVDMHWRCHGRLHKRIGHDVDVKVDDILEEHGHIYKKNMYKSYYKTHICCHKNVSIHFHNMLQLESCTPS